MAAMGSSVFISFRRKDQAGYAALLDRELTIEFGTDAVFQSTRSIEPGQDFVATVLTRLAASAVVLAVIGPEWLRHLRPDDDTDWVRRELATALGQGIPVIPILVEDATMPAEAEMPAELAALSRCHYLRLNHRSLTSDMARIVAVVAQHLQRPAARELDDEAPRGPVVHFRTAKSPCLVGAVPGSILHVRFADIWVNSENTDMEMSRHNDFTISGIVRYWGSYRDAAGTVVDDVVARQLAEQVGTRRPVAPGAVFVTGPGSLADSHNVRHLIHVATVHGEPGAGFRQVRNVGQVVAAVLARAESLAADDEATRSVLLPIFGVGDGGGSLPATARIMVSSIVDYIESHPTTLLQRILILGYRKSEFTVVRDCLSVEPRLSTVLGV
jgi:O-acetyl-ADP-ribose deacetylase (regulator of RNase III)